MTSSRSIQLGQTLCIQDRLILDLFANKAVRYVGEDTEFEQHLQTSDTAENLILILNKPMWCSDIVRLCQSNLTSHTTNFYIGINRYCIIGNDCTKQPLTTGKHGIDIIEFLKSTVSELGFCVTESGHFDNDYGSHLNYVQPLTWIYGTKNTNQTH